MRPVEEPDFAAGPAASRDAGGVVPRPALFELLQRSARVTVIAAPAGSGKTVLLRSWISAAGVAERAAWVPTRWDERDPQQFWLSVLARALGLLAPSPGRPENAAPLSAGRARPLCRRNLCR